MILKLAETEGELEAAFQILHDAYVDYGYMEPHPSGLRVTPYHALPSTSVLIAVLNGDVVATVSIVRRGAFGLPMDTIYDTREAGSIGSRVAEISALAIRKDFRGQQCSILMPLLKFMYEYCVLFFGIETLLITILAKQHVLDFYEGVLFFERLNEAPIRYSFVNNVSAVIAKLDLRTAFVKFAIH